jgi:hypothetical protein
MKALCYIAATAALLASAPAMAQQNPGGGSVNIWSSAQGTSNSYGAANGFGQSSSGALIDAAGQGLSGVAGSNAGSMTQAITTSIAGTSSNGSGYAQSQTSGYAGGSVTGYGPSGLGVTPLFALHTH